MRRLLAVLFLLSFSASAQTSITGDETTTRLATIARVWGAVKYAHPAMEYERVIDWDAAAIRAAEQAKGTAPVADVVTEMLEVLEDPMTHVTSACVEGASGPGRADARPAIVSEGVIYVPLETLMGTELDPAIAQARTVILDLRTPAGLCATPALPLFAQLEQVLVRGSLPVPQQRRILHRGYRSQEPNGSTTYGSSWNFVDFGIVSGSPEGSGAQTIFLADERTQLPRLAVAMLLARQAWIVSAGPFGEEAAIAHLRVPLGEGLEAVVRTADVRIDSMAWHFGAAEMLPAGATTEQLIDAAVKMTRPRKQRGARTGPAAERLIAGFYGRRDATYPDMAYPPFEYRALAAFRLWSIIHYFYGYPHLIGDWNARLPEIVNLLTTAGSQTEYDLALARAMTFVPDGHSFVGSKGYLDLRGRAAPAFALMPVEGKPVVYDLVDAGASGPVKPGDELLAIDGRPVAERYAEMEPYVSGSTEEARTHYITNGLAWGPVGSEATFTFRKPDGQVYETRLRRGSYQRTPVSKPWRVLEGNIGYVDLRWLTSAQVDPMIDEMIGTRGLIIDIRNYPNSVFPRLAQRLNKGGGPSLISEIRVPLIGGGVRDQPPFLQDVGTTPLPKYTGRTMTLINERAQSQSEHTCLAIDAVADTTFVGSATVGANGNVTYMVMPGAVYISFTGMDVRHLDGRQLQRVGVVPDVPVPRTIDALAHGRDEVLERAAEMLRQ